MSANRTAKYFSVVVLATMMITNVAHADVVYDAVPANSTVVNNNGTPTGLAGTAGALTYTGAASNFNNSGFTSTDNINTLNGTPLTAADTVTITLSVDSITGGAIRSQGIHFGLNGAAAGFNGTNGSSLLIQAEASNNGGDLLIAPASFQDAGDTNVQVSDAEIVNGFDLTLTADVNGYTFTLDSIGPTSPIVLNGTFTGTEFVDNFGTGHFHYSVQKFTQNTPLTTSITEASIAVTTATVPEPSSLALLGLGLVSICARRRRV